MSDPRCVQAEREIEHAYHTHIPIKISYLRALLRFCNHTNIKVEQSHVENKVYIV